MGTERLGVGSAGDWEGMRDFGLGVRDKIIFIKQIPLKKSRRIKSKIEISPKIFNKKSHEKLNGPKKSSTKN